MVVEVAIRQAVAGALRIREMAHGFEPAQASLKPSDSFTPVTVIDHEAAEAMLRVAHEELADAVCVIDEEFGTVGNTNAEWYCYQDSCDGTTNLLFEPDRVLPVAGVTYVKNGRTEVCAVADPKSGRVIYSVRGTDVRVRNFDETAAPEVLQVAKARPLPKRFVMFDALLNQQTSQAAGRLLSACGSYAQNMRTYGSCLLHLWALATGKADIVVIDAVGGFWDLGLHLACQALGCRVTDLLGEDIVGPSLGQFGAYPFVLATGPGIDHEALLSEAREVFGPGYSGFRGAD